MFLEQQISILQRFLKDHVTLKTGVMMLKNSAFPYDQINEVVVNIRDVFQKTTQYALHFKKIKQNLKPDFSMPKT